RPGGTGEMAGPAPRRAPGQQLSSAPGARFAEVETRLLGIAGAALEALELLRGLGRGQQGQRLGVAHGAGEAFGLGDIQLAPGGVQLVGAAIAVGGLAGTAGGDQGQQSQGGDSCHLLLSRGTSVQLGCPRAGKVPGLADSSKAVLGASALRGYVRRHMRGDSTMSKRVALVLGSGGARGYAHIGVIEELEARGYQIGCVAGCSMGAVVGGIYAAGKLREYREWTESLDYLDVLRLLDVSFRLGAIRGEKVFGKIHEIVGEIDIEDLAIP